MTRVNKIILAGLLAGSMMTPNMALIASAKENHGQSGQHKGWEKSHGKRFDHATHDRRHFYRGHRRDYHGKRFDRSSHDRRHFHRGDRYDHPRRAVRYERRHHGRIENRGHHNKPEIRQDFKDIRAARQEVRDSRVELRKSYEELRRDRAELRKDIRNGASKEEILQGRREIRHDLREIQRDRAELRQDQAKLDAARQELKNDLRKR